jgi:hypothetical protein
MAAVQAAQFTGRAWLLPRLLDWWDHGDARLFLLTGDPGTGKSAVMAWLAGYGAEPDDTTARAQLARLRSAVKAAHFLRAETRNIAPKAFAENVANQLTRSVRGFGDALAATLRERVCIVGVARADSAASGASLTGNAIGHLHLAGLGDELSFDRSLTEPLKRLLDRGQGEPVLLLVDALDEALGYSGDRTVPELLATLCDLPPQVRILATTNEDPRVLKFFRGMEIFDLVHDTVAGRDRLRSGAIDDVRAYATKRLASKRAIPDAARDAFAGRLADEAGGVFLYAVMVLDEIARSPVTELPDLAAYPLPAGLKGLYHALLTRELGRVDRKWYRSYMPLLGLTAVAQGYGLSASQLGDIVGRDIGEALRATRQYLRGNLPDGPFRPFHKSFADYLLEDADNIDYHIDARAMHRLIADRYWARHHEDWSASDDYGLDALAIHLSRSGDPDRLGQLISPAWMRARFTRDQHRYDGFVADLDLAWQQARARAWADIGARNEPLAAAECLRLALIRTSIASLSTRYEPALVQRAVETGLWPLARALSVATQAREARHVARLIEAALAARCPETTDAERRSAASGALPAARSIEDAQSRVIALRAFVPHLGGPERGAVLHEALAAARGIVDIAPRIRALAALAPHLEVPDREAALRAAVSALSIGQAGPWSGFGLRHQAILDALAELAPRLTGALLAEAGSAITRRFADPESRVQAVAAMAGQLADAERRVALADALASAMQCETPWGRACALVALAPLLTGPLATQALTMARELGTDEATRTALTALAPRFDGSQKEVVLREALSSARGIADEADRSRALAALAPQLHGTLLDDALQAAGGIESDVARAGALVALAPQAAGATRTACLNEGLAAARRASEGWQQAAIVSALAPSLSGPLLGEGLEIGRGIGDNASRITALVALTQHLTGGERDAALREAVDAARRGSKWERAGAQARLAPLLDRTLLADLISAQGIDDQAPCARALAALAGAMHGPRKHDALRDAMTAVAGIADEGERASELAALAPQLDSRSLAEALSAARAIGAGRAFAKSTALRSLASRFEGAPAQAILREALSAARQIDQKALRAAALAELAPRFRGATQKSIIRDALAAAREIGVLTIQQGDRSRAEVLARLSPELSGPLFAEALSLATTGMGVGRARGSAVAMLVQQMDAADADPVVRNELSAVQAARSDWECVEALFGLAPALGGSLLAQAMSIVEGLADTPSFARANALMALLPRMSGAQKESVIARLLPKARGMGDDASRARVLSALAEHLRGPEKDAALADALAAMRRIDGDETRADVLAVLAPQLSGARLAEALPAARSIRDRQCSALAMNAIAKAAREGHADLLPELRRYLIDRLAGVVAQGDRSELYEICADEHLLRPPLVSAQTVEAAALHVGDVAHRWAWP